MIARGATQRFDAPRTPNGDIVHQNYGVIFRQTGGILTDSVMYYKLVFKIPIPKPFKPAEIRSPFSKPCPDIDHPMIRYACAHFRIMEKELGQNIIYAETQIIEAQQVIEDILHSPMSIRESHSLQRRRRRSPLSFVSSFSKKIFGFATNDDLQSLALKVTDIISNQKTIAEFDNKISSDLFHFTEVVNHRVSIADGKTRANHDEIISILDKLQHWKSAILDLQGNQANITSLITILTGFLGSYVTRCLDTMGYAQYMNTYADSLQQLHQGRLTHYLITPQQIKTSLRHVKHRIATQGVGETILYEKNIEHFYESQIGDFHYSKEDMFVMILCPVARQQSQFTMFHIVTMKIPIHVHKPLSKIGVTEISIKYQYFGISTNGQTYVQMTQREYDMCKVNQNSITCQNPASRFSLPDFTCTGALYYSNHLQIQKRCKFNVFPEEQVANRAIRLAAGKFLISSKEDKAIQTCDKRKTQQIDICQFCQITINCYCSIKLGSQILVNNGDDQCHNYNMKVEKKIGINFAILTHFGYNPLDLNNLIRSNKTYQLDIPNITEYCRKFSDLSDKDRTFGLELAQTAKQIRNNSLKYKEITDKQADIDYISSILNDDDFSKIWKGINFCLMMILTPLVIYNFIKLRSTAVLAASLAHVDAVRAASLIISPISPTIIIPSPSTTITTMIPPTEEIVKLGPFPYYYILTAAVCIASFAYVSIRFLHFLGISTIHNAHTMRKIRQIWGVSQKTETCRLYLKISKGDTKAIIYLQALDYEPNLISFELAPAIVNTSVTHRFCSPTLNLTWTNDLKIFINSVPVYIRLSTNNPIPVFERKNIKAMIPGITIVPTDVNFALLIRYSAEENLLQIPEIAQDVTNPPHHNVLPISHTQQQPVDQFFTPNSHISEGGKAFRNKILNKKEVDRDQTSDKIVTATEAPPSSIEFKSPPSSIEFKSPPRIQNIARAQMHHTAPTQAVTVAQIHIPPNTVTQKVSQLYPDINAHAGIQTHTTRPTAPPDAQVTKTVSQVTTDTLIAQGGQVIPIVTHRPTEPSPIPLERGVDQDGTPYYIYRSPRFPARRMHNTDQL